MKVLFFDIDGTLIENAKGITTIPVEVKAELKRIQNLGNKLFIATGRPKLMLTEDMLSAGFDGYVAFNGGFIEIDGKSIYEDQLSYDLARKSVDLLNQLNCEYMLETSSHIYIKPEFKVLYNFFKAQGLSKMYTFDFDEDQVLHELIKIECNIDECNKKAIDAYLNSDLGFSINYDTHGTDFAFEFYSPTINKAVGIQKVLDYYHIDAKDTYSFGDGLNDLPMFKICGTNICMGNGLEEVKKQADIVCEPIEDLGLAKILKELF